MAIGRGRRVAAMTVTSGLVATMEHIGYAAMTETPCGS